MPENIPSKKRPILATIIAILLLIPTPFIIITSIGFLKDPLQKANAFDMIPKVAARLLPQKSSVNMQNFLNTLSNNLKSEYSTRMNDPKISMRKIETYQSVIQLIIAIATIFICIGLLRLKKWAYKPIIIRLLASLLLVVPLRYFSVRHMNDIMSSAINKSLYELPQIGEDERKTEILKAIVQNKMKKNSHIPVVADILLNLALIGYFLNPGVRKTFCEEKQQVKV